MTRRAELRQLTMVVLRRRRGIERCRQKMKPEENKLDEDCCGVEEAEDVC